MFETPSQDLSEPPVCAECAHLIGVRHYTQTWEQWKCGKLPTGINVVSGELQYENCLSSRISALQSQCGPEGRLFERYVPPSSAGGKASAQDLLDELERQ